MENMIKKILIGLIAGIVNGFFATGGGLILVPAFVNILNMDSQKARGTSIICILPMVLTSSFFYYKSNYIDWKLGILCGLGGAIGGFIGAKILKKLPEKVLRTSFVAFLMYVSYKMIFN